MIGQVKPRRLRQICGPIAIALASCELQGSVDTEPTGVMPQLGEKGEVPMPPENLDAKLQGMVDYARADLRKRHGPESVAAEDIDVLRAERVTWRSPALGCPLPDRAYPMVLTPGVLIVLRAGGSDFEYHGTLHGPPFLCEPPADIETPAPGRHSLDPT